MKKETVASLADRLLSDNSLPTGATREAVELLGRRIANSEYLPGEVMPTEAELAEPLGVSRTTIRDAVKVLSGKGLVRTARRYGTRVRPVEEWNLFDADVVRWHEPDQPRLVTMFAETTELRYIIEPAAAALAAERATPGQIDTILAAAEALHPDRDGPSELFAADCLFHATILDATGNLMMRQLRPLILTMLRVSYDYGVRSGEEPITREGHIEVGDAIQKRDADTARHAMEMMLDRNRRTARRRANPAAATAASG